MAGSSFVPAFGQHHVSLLRGSTATCVWRVSQTEPVKNSRYRAEEWPLPDLRFLMLRNDITDAVMIRQTNKCTSSATDISVLHRRRAGGMTYFRAIPMQTEQV